MIRLLVLARLRPTDENSAPEFDAAFEVVGFALLVVAEEGEDVGWSDEGVEGREGLGLRRGNGGGGGAHCCCWWREDFGKELGGVDDRDFWGFVLLGCCGLLFLL